MFWNGKDDMTMLGIEGDRGNMCSTQFSLFGTTRSTELKVTFVRNDRFVTAMRSDKKIITKIDETTKNSSSFYFFWYQKLLHKHGGGYEDSISNLCQKYVKSKQNRIRSCFCRFYRSRGIWIF